MDTTNHKSQTPPLDGWGVIYQNNITEGKQRIAKIRKQQIVLSTVRFVLFLVFFVTPFYFYEKVQFWALLIMFIPLAVFLLFVKLYAKKSEKRKFEQFKVEINENELDAINHKFSQFENGEEFINPEHFNSYDLDLFGKGSLFQFLNRTVTPKGKIALASMFENPILNTDKLVQRQNFIKELSKDVQWRQNFAATGKMYAENEQENSLFDTWSEQKFGLKTMKFACILIPVLAVLGVLSIFVWTFAGTSVLFSLSLILQAALWMSEGKNIRIVNEQFGKRAAILQKYGILLQLIENFEWESGEGKELVASLKKNGLASAEILKLKKIISRYDNRNNIFFDFILNLIMVWDYWHTYTLIKWHNANKQNYVAWINTIAFIDASCSLANYSYNHPESSYPEFTNSGRFELSVEQLGHPLINPQKRIDNNFDFEKETGVIIVTGANMAGKSTFLRTVGVNMVLGMTGAPVCAKRMKFKPIEVFSNMRTTDSLFDDESYFFAELKRLKAILDEINNGRELLIILDEILKGTNSVDKLYGSQKLVQRLVHQNVTSIIATHDLKLTEIENEHPDRVKNKCFEITIQNDEMQFDYILRDGVTTVMNATFLMKKMGIIDRK